MWWMLLITVLNAILQYLLKKALSGEGLTENQKATLKEANAKMTEIRHVSLAKFGLNLDEK